MSCTKPELANKDLELLCAVFEELHIPLATDKVPGPACGITYLGIEINSVEQTIAIHMRSTQNSWNCCLNGSLREHVLLDII